MIDLGSYVPANTADIIKLRGRMQVPAGTEVKAMEFEVKDVIDRHQAFKLWRGQVITNALSVEEKVEDIIRKLLFRKEVEGASIFHSIVLSREFFGFMQKCKVLEDLLRNLSPFKERSYAPLIEKIHKVISMRNKFAHGKVNYEGIGADKIVIDYFKEIPRSEEVTKESIEDFSQRCRECFQELDAILTEAHETFGK